LSPASGADDGISRTFETGLIAARQKAGLFTERSDGVQITRGVLYAARIALPAAVPVGDYTAEIHLVRKGRVLASTSAPFVIDKSGFERWVYVMAQENSLVGEVAEPDDGDFFVAPRFLGTRDGQLAAGADDLNRHGITRTTGKTWAICPRHRPQALNARSVRGCARPVKARLCTLDLSQRVAWPRRRTAGADRCRRKRRESCRGPMPRQAVARSRFSVTTAIESTCRPDSPASEAPARSVASPS
jgi:hypothetical protein